MKTEAESFVPGTDYLIVSKPKGGVQVVPANTLDGVGYETVRGGFHTLCADVGEIAGHPLSGFMAGDILPQSVWNRHHQASCPDNSGLVYDPATDMWVEIYLSQDADRRILSLSFDDFVKQGEKTGRRLLTHDEFSSAAEGSNEMANINSCSRPGTSGGHVDTIGRRMISHIGCEDCCGVVWQWLSSTLPGNADYQLLAGGSWFNGAICGSRYRNASYSRWYASSFLGARFASEPLHKRGAMAR